MANVQKVYDIEAIGGAKAVAEIDAVGEAFNRVKKIKKELNAIKDTSNDPAKIRKVTTEIEKQTTAQASNVVKMNQAVATGLKLAYVHKELELEIKNVVEKVHNETDALNDQNRAELAAIQAAGSYSKASKLLGTETETTTKKIVDQTKAIQEAKIIQANNTAALKNQIREELNAKGSLEQRRAALIRLNTVYDRLSPKERDTAWGVRLQKTILDVTNQVKGLEAITGRNQRNVGKYAEAGETGFKALAKGAGKAYGVLKQVANILPGFGIAGLIGLGIDGILALADAMHILETTTEEEKKQMEFFASLQNTMVTSIAQEESALRTLYETAVNTNISYKERGQAVDELIKQYPDYFTNANREKLLNGELSDSYDILTKSIYQRAEAQAKQTILSKLFEEKVKAEIELQKLTENNSKGDFYYSKQSVDALKAIIASKQLQIDATEKSIQLGKKEFGNDVYYINEKLKAQVEAQLKLDKAYAEHGEPSKGNKSGKSSAGDNGKALQAEKKKQAEAAQKEEEAQQKIIYEAYLSTLDDQSREIYVRTQKYEEDLYLLKNISAEDKKLLDEQLAKDLLEINTKYQDKLLEQQAKADEKLKKSQEERNKQIVESEDQLAQVEKDFSDAEAEAERVRQDNKLKILQQAQDAALQLAQEFLQSQIQIANQKIDKDYEEKTSFLSKEKEMRLAQAQSAAEKQAIEQEYEKKQTALDKKRNIERQQIAKKQLAIEFALASIKAISTSKNIYEGLIKEGIVVGEYLIALKNINSQKFEQGGQVPTSTGGDITGPSHAGGGVPFGFEAEGGEMAIINKNSTMDKGTYNLTGTPRQIASAINTIGGGVQFAPGALTRKFEYGGLLGSNLSAPVFRGYYQSSSGGSANNDLNIEALRAITSMNARIDNLKVTLDLHSVTKAQNVYSKQAQLGVI